MLTPAHYVLYVFKNVLGDNFLKVLEVTEDFFRCSLRNFSKNSTEYFLWFPVGIPPGFWFWVPMRISLWDSHYRSFNGNASKSSIEIFTESSSTSLPENCFRSATGNSSQSSTGNFCRSFIGSSYTSSTKNFSRSSTVNLSSSFLAIFILNFLQENLREFL